jgi:hypothetical protein
MSDFSYKQIVYLYLKKVIQTYKTKCLPLNSKLFEKYEYISSIVMSHKNAVSGQFRTTDNEALMIYTDLVLSNV